MRSDMLQINEYVDDDDDDDDDVLVIHKSESCIDVWC